MNKYIGDHTLTTKALTANESADVKNDLDASNLTDLDYAVLKYLKNWKYFQVTVNVSVFSPRNQHLRKHRFQLSRYLVENNRNVVFDELINASPFQAWKHVVARATNNIGYHLFNPFNSEEQLFPSAYQTEKRIRQDIREFSKFSMLWMDSMTQYKQDVLDNNWFCLDVPDRTWFITIYQK
jgi:hypothetical protein